MKHTAVRSRDLAIIGYDEKTELLEIAFRNGGVYQYRGVDPQTCENLLKAPSHGVFFNQEIKDKYPTVRVHQSA